MLEVRSKLNGKDKEVNVKEIGDSKVKTGSCEASLFGEKMEYSWLRYLTGF